MKSVTSGIKHVSGLRRELRQLTTPRYRAGRVQGGRDIKLARQFAYRVYVARHEIPAHLLNKQGLLDDTKDPYRHHSVYFVVVDQRKDTLVAASRLILPKKGHGPESLQIDVASLNSRAQNYLAALGGHTIAEPASYAKAKGVHWMVTTYLLREMLHYSLDNNIDYWLIALNPHIEETYRRRFGGAMHKLGSYVFSKVDLEGRQPKNVPYVVDVKNAIKNLQAGSLSYRLFMAPLVKKFMSYRPHATDNHIIHLG